MQSKKRGVLLVLFTLLILLLTSCVLSLGWMWYDTTVDRSGWQIQGGSYIHLDFYGDIQTGWHDIDGKRYYFDPESGAMRTRWQDIDGKRYWFGTDGALDVGWQDIDGHRFYLGSDGVLRSGWQDIDGIHCYLTPDTGLHTGWLELEDGTWFLGADGNMLTGWKTLDTGTYYFGADGRMVTGDQELDGKSYRFGENGVLFSGWAEEDGQKIYYTAQGPLATLWQEIDGSLYYFNEEGHLQTGWLQLGEYRYYLHEDGHAATTPTVIDGETYYFTPKGIHVVLVNEDIKVPGYYSPNLVTIEGQFQVADVCHDALRRMLDDCKAAGNKYTFNSSYRTIGQQQAILTQRTKEYEDKGMDSKAAYWKARSSVALPGTSEHHLGLAVDLLGDGAIAWFNEHCWEYGFIVRYLEGKSDWTGIIHEPWHFRYVGTEVSLEMQKNGLCLEEYLGAEPCK